MTRRGYESCGGAWPIVHNNDGFLDEAFPFLANVGLLGRMVGAACLMVSIASCATGSRLHPDPNTADDAGALRVTQVVLIATRQEIVSLGEHYRLLLASGIADSDLVDGSLIEGRIYCCGGPNESGTAPWAFVPRGIQLGKGDIVEVRMGRPPSNGNPGTVNTVLRVRQKAGESGPCRWIPDDPQLWTRYLYCSWMEQEGWQQRGGLYPAWLKPAAGPQ